MVARGHVLGTIVMLSIIIFGVIHLIVAIVIIAQDGQYSDLFGPQIGLSGYNIIIALMCFVVGAFGLLSVLTNRGALSKLVAIGSIVLCIFTFASLITALVINGQSNGYVSGRFVDEMNRYVRNADAVKVIDSIQTKYKCCGENLWLDWAYTPLGTTLSGGSSLGLGRRRRRHSTSLFNALIQHFRQKRQSGWTTQNVNTLPLNYGVYLPGSCCINGGTTIGNSQGTYCVTTGSGNSFYLSGCLQPIANRAVSQIMGTSVINCFLIVISIIAVPTLIHLYPENFRLRRKTPKQTTEPEQYYQEPQYQQPEQEHQYSQNYPHSSYQQPAYQHQYQEPERHNYSEPWHPPPQYQPYDNHVYTVNSTPYHTERNVSHTYL